MNCGWHSACNDDPPPFGSVLDWQNSGGSYVNWRSYGYRSDDNPVPLGTGQISNDHSTCKGVKVSIVDAYNVSRGTMRYSHSESSWAPASFNIPANGTGYGQWHAGAVGPTASTELSACAYDPPGPVGPLWSGAHLHQGPQDGSWTINQGAYCKPVQGDDCEGDTFPNILVAGYHHAHRYWAWIL